ncbi:MAG: hypothetical protein IPL51_01440 [Candidatus Competibacteraceae bacterium]|nr:hypothetical protein [Candidatus Competibacteraceae bacterium]
MKEDKTMVSSYLICDECGRFGPPAGFLSQNGLRLCYQCWFQQRLDDQQPPTTDPTTESEGESALDRPDYPQKR